MKRCDSLRMVLLAGLGMSLAWSSLNLGCNPNFIAALGGEASLPTAPGTNPYVLVRIVNLVEPPAVDPFGGSTAPAGYLFYLDWRYAGGNNPYQTGPSMTWWYNTVGLSPVGADYGQLVDCNITGLTMGNTSDLTQPGAFFDYNYGGTSSVLQPMAVFGKMLQNGVDFRCGDVITFVTYSLPEDSRSYGVDYQVQSGEGIEGPFSGPDTFGIYAEEDAAWRAARGM